MKAMAIASLSRAAALSAKATSKTTAPAGGLQLDDDTVREYLKNNDDFLQRHPDMLDYLHVSTGTRTVPTATVRLKKGDEVLTTDHEYNASRNALDFVAARDGARVVVAALGEVQHLVAPGEQP